MNMTMNQEIINKEKKKKKSIKIMMVYVMNKVVEVFCLLCGDRSSVNRFNSKYWY